MIPRKKVLFFVYSQNDHNNPQINMMRSDVFLPFGHSRVALERNVNPIRLASRSSLFDPEISGCSPG
jgi:hypothetical protein